MKGSSSLTKTLIASLAPPATAVKVEQVAPERVIAKVPHASHTLGAAVRPSKVKGSTELPKAKVSILSSKSKVAKQTDPKSRAYRAVAKKHEASKVKVKKESKH